MVLKTCIDFAFVVRFSKSAYPFLLLDPPTTDGKRPAPFRFHSQVDVHKGSIRSKLSGSLHRHSHLIIPRFQKDRSLVRFHQRYGKNEKCLFSNALSPIGDTVQSNTLSYSAHHHFPLHSDERKCKGKADIQEFVPGNNEERIPATLAFSFDTVVSEVLAFLM